MVDQLGPGIHSVRECATLGFADLGDVSGFDEEGEGVYGFRLAKDGIYVRTPVAIEEPDWDVRLLLRMPHLHLRGSALSHLGNTGRMLVSYAPGKTQKGLAVVEGQTRIYILKMKAEANANAPIEATTTFAKDREILAAPHPGSTIYLEIVLGESSPPKKWVEVLPGLKLQWDSPMIVGLIVQNPGGKIAVKATNSTLRTQVGSKVGLEYFQIEPQVDFIRLLFTTMVVDTSYLDGLSLELEQVLALLSKT